ncbi:MAG: DUF4070 domain-containing protein [Deltaproteobacteria bacterium]|nr:MAG: DUF4070 domain-containing protein [Deltaproteobacteria bacterium]
MKILFVYPSFERHAQSNPELLEYVPAEEYLGPPSLGIASVAACTPEGFEVGFIDDRLEPLGDNPPEADLYALSFFTPAATRAFEIADALRAVGKKVVAGGVFPTMMPDECAPHFDSVVVGEGEPVWPQLCRDAEAGSLQKIYRAQEPARLDTLPQPRVDLYFASETESHSPHDYPVQLSRGCPFRCFACAVPGTMGSKIRYFPEDWCRTLLGTMAKAGKRCSLTEDTALLFLSGARRRLQQLLEGLLRDPLPERPAFSYLGTSVPLLLQAPAELLSLLGRAGFHRLYIVCGFDPVTRDAYSLGKREAMEKCLQAVERCRDAGMEPYMSFLAGADHDDESIFDRLLEFCTKARLEIAEFAIATPYPGTPVWNRLEAEGRIFTREWRRYNDANVVFRPKNMTPERLLEGYIYLWREFYRGRQHLRSAGQEGRTVQF